MAQNVVEEYWSGVLNRLQAEVESFNQIIAHLGEKGRENELSLARVLERLIPTRYAVGSGLLIDADGHSSRQLDIIIYDQADEPAIFGQTTQVLYPVENVRACIEVKTTANKTEIQDAGKKCKSVRSLKSRTNRWPVIALAAYSASQMAETLATHLLELDASSERPEIACVIELGFLAAPARLLATSEGDGSDAYVAGITPLQVVEDGTRSKGKYVPVPDSHAMPTS
jgi:hypothetical protein